MSKFKVGDKVHLLNSVGDIVYGNRGTVMAEFKNIVTGDITYEVFFNQINDTLQVSINDIDTYNNPHIGSAFNIERIE